MSRLLPVLAALAVGILAAAATAQAACSCPTPATVTQFDAQRYLGTWLEMRRVARSMEQGGQCGTAHYSWTDASNKTVNVVNTNYLTEKAATRTVNLLATPTDLAAGKFTVSWPKFPQIPDSAYWVLGTDYEKYAVVYSCGEPSANSPGGLPSITLWVLARSLAAYEDADTQAKVKDILDNSGLPTDALEDVHQTSCPADTCSACPSSVKTDLDLDKLAGRWWEVQHGIFSKGGARQGCSRDLVSKTDEGVQIDLLTAEYSDAHQSTSVNKSLSAKWTDSSKKSGDFTITKGFSGDSADRLCVLGTDYDNWAAISICAKQSGAAAADDLSLPSTGGVWVLSRKRGLTADQQDAANKAVSDAGFPVADLVMTPSTPCAAAALEDDSSAAAAVTPLVLLVAALAAAARLF